jgi:hypothetical protein
MTWRQRLNWRSPARESLWRTTSPEETLCEQTFKPRVVCSTHGARRRTREFRHYLQRAKGRRILGHCFRRRPDSPALSAVFGSIHESVRPSRRTSNKSAAVDDVERVSHQPARRIARRPRALATGLTPWLPSVSCTHRSQRRKPLRSPSVRRGDGVRAESAIRCLSHYERWFACHRQPGSFHLAGN